MSYPFKHNYAKPEVSRRKSMIRHSIIGQSWGHQNNQQFQDRNTTVSDPPNLQSLQIFGKATQHRPNVSSKCFFCWLTLPIVLGIGAVVTIAAVIISQPSKIPGNNWVIDGDGETGSCEAGAGIVHPTDWNYNGPITQIYYNNTSGDLYYTDPGPSDRGNCYFYGQVTNTSTSMWQTLNISDLISPFLIDNQKIRFNFSAWLGGYSEQDDNARVSLVFTGQASLQVGNSITLGPILSADRGNVTSLLFQPTNGLIPTGARSFTVTVTITCVHPPVADGDIDNIALVYYQ